MKHSFALLVALLLTACGSPPGDIDGDDGGMLGIDAAVVTHDGGGGGDGGGSGADATPGQPDAVPGTPDANTTPATAVDLLFVIDDSGGMAGEQNELFGAMGGFIDDLRIEAGGTLPSLHVGVVSTNLGSGPFDVGGCPGNGDGAILLDSPTSFDCPTPSDRYIVDEPDGTGGRTRNYPGASLANAIECIGDLGTDGCGFEQPLEAMRRALDGSVSENAGFLRDDSLLVVVVLTNEDDCSVENTDMFGPSGGALGPLSSFRCFEFGVVCTPDEPRTPGAKTGCASREDSMYMYPVQPYIDFLKTLRPGGRVIVAGVMATESPVEVGLSGGGGGNPTLLSACTTASTGGADPPVRLHMWLDDFGADGLFASLCDENIPGELSALAAKIAGKL